MVDWRSPPPEEGGLQVKVVEVRERARGVGWFNICVCGGGGEGRISFRGEDERRSHSGFNNRRLLSPPLSS